ncbi:hypothetical protein G7Y89_g2434 [Cudoniella acicularis]|uniref:OTU domain-containing protein n=1 Tax=Cudoniella acicularis TaxID=354080 RepID=A0A8H4W6Z1_9HELO|nr:hypothetical protein G7Y89_g2434 [Cudoniella acicularis]
MARSDDEFPLLTQYGLKATPIRGDGNCLFNALSDQMYGHQNNHHEIRQTVIKQMRGDSDWYKQFIDVPTGGGFRRNPKRKNVGASSSTFQYTPPTQEQIDAVWEAHLDRMAKGGTYGDNMEIRAFTKAYNMDVRIFDDNHNDYYVKAADDGVTRPVAYIAYHSWEHYSSVRNITGPHSGPPQVVPKNLSSEEAATAKANLPDGPVIQDWMIQTVQNALQQYMSEETIRKALTENNGNVNNTVDKFLEVQDYSSAPPTPGSLSQSGASSIERDPDSDDDEVYGPNKRQNRRMSQATKALRKQQQKLIDEKELAAIPTIALTKAEDKPLIETVQTSPLKPGLTVVKREDKDQSASDGDDEFRPEEDSNSEYSASSRSQSVVPGTTPPRPRIILHTRNSRQASEDRSIKNQSNNESANTPAVAQSNPKSTFNPTGKKKLITARQRKEMKKAAQKQAAKERKRGKGLTASTDNIKRNSPPMEKVLSLGKLSMIQI